MRWLVFLVLCMPTIVLAEAQAQQQIRQCHEPAMMMMIQDGSKMSSQDMLSIQGAVGTYINKTRVFLNCLLEAEKVQGKVLTLEQKKESIMRYNLAVAKMEGLVENFNQQLRTHKGAQGE